MEGVTTTPTHPISAHGHSDPGACSVVAEAVDVPAFGTAAPARFWVGVEQPGPWGRVAALQSHLPKDVGTALDRECSNRGGRLVLVRRPGSHPDPPRTPQRLFAAWSGPGEFLLSTHFLDPERLLDLDLDALARGDASAVAASLPDLVATDPVLLVCTNGRRDVCCAVRGRPVALAGHAAYPKRVWECSHTGGHRFSATGVLLPWGRTLARLEDEPAHTLLDAADDGRLPSELLGPRNDRGWSAIPAPWQAAESLVREVAGATDLAAARIDPQPGASVAQGGPVRVTLADGRAWLVEVTKGRTEPHPGSCGQPAVPSATWTPRIVEPAGPAT